MKQPTKITFQNHKIRTVKRDGATWFVASDVFKSLIAIPNLMEALDDLTPYEISAIDGKNLHNDTEPQLGIISESGFKKLIPQASKAEKNTYLSQLSENWRNTGSEIAGGIEK